MATKTARMSVDHSKLDETVKLDGSSPDPAILQGLRDAIDAEFQANSSSLSPSLQYALTAAQLTPALTLRTLVLQAKALVLRTAIPQFWSSIDTSAIAQPSNLAQLAATLRQMVTGVQALQTKVEEAIEYYRTKMDRACSEKEASSLANVSAIFLKNCGHAFLSSARSGLRFQDLFARVYASALRSLAGRQSEGDDNDGDEAAETHTIAPSLQSITDSLRQLGLWEMLYTVEASALKNHIHRRLKEAVDESPGGAVLEEALEYNGTVPLQYLEMLRDPKVQETAEEAAARWKLELDSLVRKEICSIHTNAMFDLVIDYPDSLPALQDLKACLRYTDGYRPLVAVFGRAIRTRLLQPGAATTDIIHHYVSTIRSMRHIDQSGVCLDLISEPLKRYLRTRKDAIRCIVTMITEDDTDGEGPGFLAELEAEGEGYDPDADFFGPKADKLALEEIDKQLWEPPPFHIPGKEKVQRSVAPGDVIGQLVNIYGSKELFVTEYRSMLADRLLSKIDFDCDRELRTLELLKVRFGEAALHAAEVMIRDLGDSKRINANIRNMANTLSPLKAFRNQMVPLDQFGVTIVSELFWPQLPKEEFKMPRGIESMMRTFGHKYHALKTPRELRWKPGLGTVDLTLTIGDRDMEFNVSPLHAAMLVKFEVQAEWSPADLGAELGITNEVLRRKIVYWINHGVIMEIRDQRTGLMYRRNEDLLHPVGGPLGGGDVGMEVDEEERGAGLETNPMAPFEPFVLGMLTNFDALPLDRIHNMLKMFVTDPPYDRTMEQLSEFMGQLSTQDKVVLEGNVYKRRSGDG